MRDSEPEVLMGAVLQLPACSVDEPGSFEKITEKYIMAQKQQ